jgi:hypothetical protein
MRGFETGDEIEIWPAWRGEDAKARRVRATLINWDEDGITVSLEREAGMLSLIPWVQVRLVRRPLARTPGLKRIIPATSFAWNREGLKNP